jgi:hypothetical protein
VALVDELVYLGIRHFIGTKMNSSYATTAGSTKYATQALSATYANVSKEAERLNLGGTMIYIDPANHYIIFTAPNMDLSKSLMIDVVNRNILNVNVITNLKGEVICPK